MGTRKMLYLAWNKDSYLINLSHNPMLDLAYHVRQWNCHQIWILSPPLPLGQAIRVLQQISTPQERAGATFTSKQAAGISTFAVSLSRLLKIKNGSGLANLSGSQLKGIFKASQNALRELGVSGVDRPQLLTCSQSQVNGVRIASKLKGAARLLQFIQGRLLFLEEIEQVAQYHNLVFDEDLEDLLQVLYLQGRLEVFPGVGINEQGARQCFRCGGTEKIRESYCLECGSNHCYYCENCIYMGESRQCKALFALAATDAPKQKNLTISFQFQLTAAQRDASKLLWQFVRVSPKSKCLVWAACGAGKTEVSFAAIGEVLAKGYKVLFAVPRRDAVVDIEKRIKECFKTVEVAALYAGSDERFKSADLVVATTHQALRFYHAFHLVVLDEVDAFPYHGSALLYYSVKRAAHPRGRIIYLTATPPDYLLKAGISEMERITIPVRHHGYPLPVPELKLDRSMQLQEERVLLSDEVLKLLHQSVEGELAQVLVFVPTIFLAERVASFLKREFELPPFNNFDGSWVNYTHSQDSQRDKKRDDFLRGDFPVLVSTSLLERGINIPKVNVLVLFAQNHYIYDTRTLVQMAGRAGRTTEYPDGRVWFIGSRITPAMREAVKWINKMNKEAAEQGYLKRLPMLQLSRLKRVR